MTTVVTIVPAHNRVDTIAATVTAIAAIDAVDRVLVVDDGSDDGTTEAARTAGAEVLVLPSNRGKGGAVLAGVAASPEADVYLLIDADLAATAGVADQLLGPVLADEVDMTIAVLPSAGGKGGFGKIRDLAARGIKRACGREVRAPLSGQRAVRADLLRDLPSADRFGLEVALTIDAVRAGARVVEVDLLMDHRHTGRGVAGFRHRAGQGVDICRSLWPRVTTVRQRVAIGIVLFVAVVAGALWSGSQWVPSSTTLPEKPPKVIVFGMAPLGFAQLGKGQTPVLDGLMKTGAVAAMSVRTSSRRPSLSEGYLSLGAGYRLRAPAGSSEAYATSARLSTGTAGQVVQSRTGFRATGEIAVVGGARSLDANRSDTITSKPGALADALAAVGKAGAVVGNADQPDTIGGPPYINRPGALAVMDSKLSVPYGTVQPQALLRSDPLAPFGVRADPDKVLAAAEQASTKADLLVIDPGDLSRADAFGADATINAQHEARDIALQRTDALLGRVIQWAGPDTLVLVVSVSPGGSAFRLTPMVAVGAGVQPGYIFSPSTKRDGIVALTDLAPTILDALGVPIPETMPGHALRYHPGDAHLSMLRDQDRDTAFRERTYYPWAVWFIVFQALVYLVGAMVVSRRSRLRRSAPLLRVLALAAAAFPVATFFYRMIPGSAGFGLASSWVLIAITAVLAMVAARARRNPLSSLDVLMALTVLVIGIDASTGTWLHVDSWLGYSLHSAGRFYGIPNTTFAVLAATALLLGASRLQYADRRREALLGVGALLAIVALIDGAPSLGGDVGGIITLVPLFGLAFVAFTGRKVRIRTVVLLIGVTVLALGAATAVDLLRPAEAQTHLGRFATRVYHDGPSELTDTFLRKQSANFRILRVSIWTWMIPILAGFVLYVLVWERQWRRILPTNTPLRTGAIAVVAGALLGFLANDSGPIVIALFFVYILPYLLLLALDNQRGDPVLLSPRLPPEGDAAAAPTGP